MYTSLYSDIHEYLWSPNAGKALHSEDYISVLNQGHIIKILQMHVLVLSLLTYGLL